MVARWLPQVRGGSLLCLDYAIMFYTNHSAHLISTQFEHIWCGTTYTLKVILTVMGLFRKVASKGTRS